jgi:hypothetical protein
MTRNLRINDIRVENRTSDILNTTVQAICVSGKFLDMELLELPNGFSVSYCVGLCNATATRPRDPVLVNFPSLSSACERCRCASLHGGNVSEELSAVIFRITDVTSVL